MKYIIEIAKEYEEYFKGILICGIAEGKFAVDVIAKEDLEELNSDYINEHYGDLQDTAYKRGVNDGSIDVKERVDGAYQRGLEDAWEAARKVIHLPEGVVLDLFTDCYSSVCTALQVFLKYEGSEVIEKLKAYEEKQKADDEIKVGDEVETKDGKRFVVTTFESGYGGDIAVGVCADGLGLGVDLEELHKTGRHFDIASILKEMQSQ